MTGIINSLKFFIDLFKALVMLPIYIIQTLIMLLRIIFTIVEMVLALTSTIPTWLFSFISATLIISVLYIILGRNGGKSK